MRFRARVSGLETGVGQHRGDTQQDAARFFHVRGTNETRRFGDIENRGAFRRGSPCGPVEARLVGWCELARSTGDIHGDRGRRVLQLSGELAAPFP